MYTKKLKAPATEQLEQYYGGYIIKWLSEEEFWRLGRYRYFATLREAQERERERIAKKKELGSVM